MLFDREIVGPVKVRDTQRTIYHDYRFLLRIFSITILIIRGCVLHR